MTHHSETLKCVPDNKLSKHNLKLNQRCIYVIQVNHWLTVSNDKQLEMAHPICMVFGLKYQ